MTRKRKTKQSGQYVDNVLNRRLGRVGLPYGMSSGIMLGGAWKEGEVDMYPPLSTQDRKILDQMLQLHHGLEKGKVMRWLGRFPWLYYHFVERLMQYDPGYKTGIPLNTPNLHTG